MKTLVLIDDDPLFTSQVANHFRHIRLVVLPKAETNPSQSAIDLIGKHPRAHVWINLAIQHHSNGDEVLNGVGLAARLIRDGKIAPGSIGG